MKNRLISFILVVVLALTMMPSDVVKAEVVMQEVVVTGLTHDEVVIGLDVNIGSSLESYSYDLDGLTVSSDGTLTLPLPEGYAQIGVLTAKDEMYYVGTVTEAGKAWSPVEKWDAKNSDFLVGSTTTTVQNGSILTVTKPDGIDDLEYTWQRGQMVEEAISWSDVGQDDNYHVGVSDVGYFLRVVLTRANHYGKLRLSCTGTDVVKAASFVVTPVSSQNYIFDNAEKKFQFTVSDKTVDGFVIDYRRSGTDDVYRMTPPILAGSYDVRVSRTADDTYGEYEQEFTEAIKIQKKTDVAIRRFVCADCIYTGQPIEIITVLEGNEIGLPVTFSYKKKGETEYTSQAPVVAGNYEVRALIEETDSYTRAYAVAEFRIVEPEKKPENQVAYAPVYSMTGSQVNLSMKVGGTSKVSLTTNGTIRYTSTDSNVVSVASDGRITAKRPGIATINVAVDEDSTLRTSFTVKVTLNTPTKLKKSKVTKKSIKLTWKKSAKATSYTIYRSTKKKGKYKAIKTLKSTSYTDKKLKRKKSYYYKVRANAASSSYSSGQTKAVKIKTK